MAVLPAEIECSSFWRLPDATVKVALEVKPTVRATQARLRRLIALSKALKETLLPIYGFPIIKLSDRTLIFY